jgi:hypothetical protein
MTNARLLLFAALLPLTAVAEDPKNLDQTMDAIAKDMATLQRLTQSPRWTYNPSTLRITKRQASVYKGADTDSGVLTKLPEGQSVPIVDKAGEWYAITFDNERKPLTGWVQAGAAVPEPVAFGPHPLTGSDVYEAAVEQLQVLKEKYSKNPYVRISGFSVEASLSPAVTVDFEFK